MTLFKSVRTVKAALIVAGLALGGAAVAQTTPAPAPAAPAPAAPAAALPPLSPSHLAIAIDVVRATGMSRSIDIMVPETVARARAALTQMRPELAAELSKTMDTLKPEFDGLADEAIKIAANAFGHRLSEPELAELKKFFLSDIGVKFVKSQPAIIEEMYRNLDTFSTTMSQLVVDRVREDMKKKGHTL